MDILAIFFVVAMVTIWATVLYMYVKRKTAGVVLQDLGYSGENLLYAGLCGLSVGIFWGGRTDHLWGDFPWLSLGLAFFYMSVGKTEIRTKGMLLPGRLIKWEKIKAYDWRKGPGLHLYLTSKIWGSAELLVPPMLKDQVDQLVRNNISAQ